MPPVMGYGVLEPYEAKVSRTVPRRGGGSNLSSLFYIATYQKGKPLKIVGENAIWQRS